MYSIGQKVAAFIIAIAMLVALAGCSGEPLSTREKGTGIGALLGAGTGAIIGAAVGAPGAGAAIGGALGAGTGFVVGNAMQNQEKQTAQTQSQLQSQQTEIEQQRREIEQMKSQSETEYARNVRGRPRRPPAGLDDRRMAKRARSRRQAPCLISASTHRVAADACAQALAHR